MNDLVINKTDITAYVRRVEALQELRVTGRLVDVFKELKDDENYAATGNAPPPTKYPEFAEQKKALRDLLDMSDDERAKMEAILTRAAQESAAAARRQEEADRAAAESRSLWLGQGCPTGAEVKVMHALKLKTGAAF